MRKNLVPTKYPLEKTLKPRNTQEKKLWTLEIPTRKYMDPPNSHEKTFRKYEIPTRKKFGSTKYPREKI